MHARRTAQHLATGLSPDVTRGPRMERRAHGLLRPAGLDAPAHVQRIDDAVGLLLPGMALGGWASLHHQGSTWFDGHADGSIRRALIHCGPGTQLRRRDVVEPFRGLLHPQEVTQVDGTSVTTLERAAFDEARLTRSDRAAVVVIDMAVSSTHGLPHTSIAAIRRVVASHWKVRGIVRARRALELASTRSASPLESWTRLVAHLDADLVRLWVNVPVFDGTGELLGVADLLDPETGLVIEVDGSGHREAAQHALDDRREEAFEQAGCVVARVGALDLRERWDLVARLRRAQDLARRPRQQEWTTEAPDWWHTWSGAERWM